MLDYEKLKQEYLAKKQQARRERVIKRAKAISPLKTDERPSDPQRERKQQFWSYLTREFKTAA